MNSQTTNSYDVFISYARKDYIDQNKQVLPDNVISKIKQAFDNSSITYWIDESGIYSGDAFAKLIANSIKNCKIFLFISSKNSNASEWTVGEVAIAREYKKKIIPFRLDDTEYNEGVILYLASLDFISYKQNQQRSIERVVSAVMEYKNKLLKKQLEEERLREEEEKRKLAKEEQEWIKRQTEVQRKEQERLAAIAVERKKKEEELNNIYSQIQLLDTESAEWEEKKIQLDNEIKTIEHKLTLIDKQRSHLVVKRDYLAKQLSLDLEAPLISEPSSVTSVSDTTNNTHPVLEHDKTKEQATQGFLSQKKNKIILLCVLVVVLVVLLLSALKGCSQPSLSSYDSTLTYNAVDSSWTQTADGGLSIVPCDEDMVYGIETVARINWSDLNIQLQGETDKLHKVSFAFIKVSGGLKNLNAESKWNRDEAAKAGIKLGLYHWLNAVPKETNPTGKKQAEVYRECVGELKPNELSPVLVFPEINGTEQAQCALERANEWIDEIVRIYGVTPIVQIGKTDYKNFFKGRLHTCKLWMTDDEVIKPTFIRLVETNTRLYNGLQPAESRFESARLTVFSGTYQEFKKFAQIK